MAESRQGFRYLSEIDGLRAFAVVAVLLFHLEVTGFAGGFVGVDIFFVISGFLISGLLRRDMQKADFSFAGFYARRITRLFPAVLATVTATTLVAAFILTPDQMAGFTASALASVLSAANFVFYFESGYWDISSDFKPLLHLWSLGVEEQFYLLWPAALFLAHKWSGGVYRLGLLIIFSGSLAACVMTTQSNEAAAFYLLPFRIWQFVLGAMAAEMWREIQLTERIATVVRATGLIVCSTSVVFFSEATLFPGSWALLPSVGAALILVAANEKSNSFLLTNTLAIRMGRLSYCLYLVHWPPIAFYYSATLREMTPGAQLALGALSIILAIALHHGVERRFYSRGMGRQMRWHSSATYTLGAALLATLILVPAQFTPERFTTKKVVLSADQIAEYSSNRYRLISKVCRIDELGRDQNCPNTEEPSVLFIGNSHEPDAFNIIAAAVGSANLRPSVLFGTINGCSDLIVTEDWVSTPNFDCQERLSALRASLQTTHWHTIVYGARKPYAKNKEPLVQILETIRANQPGSRLVLIDDYLSTTRPCAALINHFGSSKLCGAASYIEGLPGFSDYEMPMRPRLEAIIDVSLDKTALLCGDILPSSCPTQTPDGHPFSIDQHHLTFEFAQWIGAKLSNEHPQWLEALRAPSRNPTK